MKIIETTISDIKILVPQIHTDERGWFMETFQQQWFEQNIGSYQFVQENHSYSKQGVLRGLHYQAKHTQAKLVRVISGGIFDVAVDIRVNSPTFGQWVGVELSAENRKQLWIPAGFAHGFYVLSEYAECVYQCSDYYHPASEQTIIWNDPTINIQWPLIEQPILSEKDKNGKKLVELRLLNISDNNQSKVG